MLSLLQEYYYCYCRMNIIVTTAIALRVMLHEDYIYHMPVIVPPLLLLPLKHIYPRHQLVDMQYCPSMATMVSSDPNLIPSVAQFHLWLLHECYYCCMYIMAPAKKFYHHFMKHYCCHIDVITAVSLRVPLLHNLLRVWRPAEYCVMLLLLHDMQPHDIPKHCYMDFMAPACLLLLLPLLLNYNSAASNLLPQLHC